MIADHPRACGENSPGWRFRLPARGSSPRVRGKLADRVAGHGARGIIPARAGKTGGGRCGGPPRADHPRACGENEALAASDATDKGSSPRVRGKRNECTGHPVVQGIIPARAGKTAPTSMTARSRTDHPRACGENTGLSQAAARSPGSSPRVRGKPRLDFEAFSDTGLIPARAGKTGRGPPRPRPRRAHPRACGENPSRVYTWSASRGSSPRVRGKHRRWHPRLRAHRLIPARAGKTSTRASPRSRRRAHPRACGENTSGSPSSPPEPGSSPRVRGKRERLTLTAAPSRLIPARAGKTSTATAPSP